MIEWFMLIASLILAVITGVYVLLTRKLVNIQQEMLKISNTPELNIFLTYGNMTVHSYTVDLCISNTGTGSALDLKFSGNFSSFKPKQGAHTLADWEIIRNGISHFGPGRHYQRAIYDVKEYNSIDLPTEILTMNIEYKDVTGKEYAKTFRLNFNHIESYLRTEDPSIGNINGSLLRIDNNLREIKNSINQYTGYRPNQRQ